MCNPTHSGPSQAGVTWEGYGINGIQYKKREWGVGFSHTHLCDCGKPAGGHTVTADSGRVPATNQGLKNPELAVLLWYLVTQVFLEKGHRTVVLIVVECHSRWRNQLGGI